MPQQKGGRDDSEGTVGGHGQSRACSGFRSTAGGVQAGGAETGPGGGRAEPETSQRLRPKPWGPVGFGDRSHGDAKASARASCSPRISSWLAHLLRRHLLVGCGRAGRAELSGGVLCRSRCVRGPTGQAWRSWSSRSPSTTSCRRRSTPTGSSCGTSWGRWVSLRTRTPAPAPFSHQSPG